MDSDLAQLVNQAIQSAVTGNWKIAERLNRTILKNHPNDLETLLRLANALTQLGKVKDSAATYQKVIKIDKYNPFAQRGLEKIKKIKKVEIAPALHSLQTMFLEEPGKTKTVGLVHLAGAGVIANLDSGQRVALVPRRHRISVTTEAGVYIGRLPDDISVRLFSFISVGNKYEAVIKSAGSEQVKIFIRETYQSPKFGSTPSFPPDNTMFSPLDSDNA